MEKELERGREIQACFNRLIELFPFDCLMILASWREEGATEYRMLNHGNVYARLGMTESLATMLRCEIHEGSHSVEEVKDEDI